jgi:uncharacterized protein YcfJ
MNLLQKLTLGALSLAALPLAATAQVTQFEDYGRVTKVMPKVEQQRFPREECKTEYVQVPVAPQQQQRSAGGSIVGAIAGGIIGNQIGGGSGRAAATAVGAITGAVVGDRIDNDGRQTSHQPQGYQEQAVRQCRTVDAWEARTIGYEVTYDYRGRSYTTVMPRDPGQRLRLRVSVEPEYQQ